MNVNCRLPHIFGANECRSKDYNPWLQAALYITAVSGQLHDYILAVGFF